jgi:hypothetical protein
MITIISPSTANGTFVVIYSESTYNSDFSGTLAMTTGYISPTFATNRHIIFIKYLLFKYFIGL